MKKIKILGAGPSGLSAAINLAKAGYEVDVFERNKDVGIRFNGDLQGLENWSGNIDVLEELKEMNININFDCNPFKEVIFSNGSKNVISKFNRPLFYLVKRGSMQKSFDQGLKKQAIKLGVNINFKKTIPSEKADIIATGPITNIIFGVDKGIIFKTKMEDMAIGLINDKAAYKFYSYLLITKGYGCMCTVVAVDKARLVNNYFEETKKIFSKMLKLDIQQPKNVGGVGSFTTRNIFKKDKTLFVGEAAGIQDGLWGFGIRNAIKSGFLAARSIINNENYEKLAKKYFNPRLKASVVNRFLWEIFGRNDYLFVLNRLENIKDQFKFLYSVYNYNFIQRLIYLIAWLYIRKRYKKYIKKQEN